MLCLLASCAAVAFSDDAPPVYEGLAAGLLSHDHVDIIPEISSETKAIDEETPLSSIEVQATLSDAIVFDGTLSN